MQDDSSPFFTIDQPGEYYVVVTGTFGAPVNFGFRLVEVASASTIAFGATITGSPPAGQRLTDTYRVLGNAGDRIAFDGQGETRNFDYRIFAPNGIVIAQGNVQDDVFPITLNYTGEYFVRIDARTPVGSYQFRVLNIADATPFAIGDTVTTSLATPREILAYQFTGVAGQEVIFDGMSPLAVNAFIRTPGGDNLAFLIVDRDSDIIKLPIGGTYTLYVQGTATTGPISFRLVDLASAELYAPDSLATGSLAPSEAKIFRMNVTPGQQFLYDGIGNFATNVTFRAYRPNGAGLIGPINADADSGIVTIQEAGPVYIVVSNNTAAADEYRFVLFDADAAPLVPLGVDVSASFATGRERVLYRVDAAVGDRFVLDGIQPQASVAAQLVGSGGALVLQANIPSDTLGTITRAGDHYFVLSGFGDAPTTATFRLHEVSDAPVLPLGVSTGVTFTPGSALAIYRINWRGWADVHLR